MSQRHYSCTKLPNISWEVMKICPLKISEIRYWSFLLSVTLHVSYVCYVKQAPGPHFALAVRSLYLDSNLPLSLVPASIAFLSHSHGPLSEIQKVNEKYEIDRFIFYRRYSVCVFPMHVLLSR